MVQGQPWSGTGRAAALPPPRHQLLGLGFPWRQTCRARDAGAVSPTVQGHLVVLRAGPGRGFAAFRHWVRWSPEPLVSWVPFHVGSPGPVVQEEGLSLPPEEACGATGVTACWPWSRAQPGAPCSLVVALQGGRRRSRVSLSVPSVDTSPGGRGPALWWLLARAHLCCVGIGKTPGRQQGRDRPSLCLVALRACGDSRGDRIVPQQGHKALKDYTLQGQCSGDLSQCARPPRGGRAQGG